ncbi:transglycosylase SLT domain-containing protein [Acetobacter papayae]|uniref:transglycosylase SLT domain-containing protein n=1 Tax=Acetobacter papayae TaxID=1076592 RepID=UPI0039EB9552
MRAIGHIPHQIAAKAILASAALLASASVGMTRANAKPPENGHEPYSDEQLAMVVPRPAFPEGDDLALPKPLPPEIAAEIRAIFRLQHQGSFAEAINATTHLTDSTLLGELEADRYLNPAYHPSATELRNWLKQYTGYADAPAIWARLAALPDRGGPLPPAPPAERLAPQHMALASAPRTQDFSRNPLLDRTVHERTNAGLKGARSALHLISITPGITPAYASQLQAETAQALLAEGETDIALDISRNAFEESHEHNALAAFMAGLALWQKGEWAEAAQFFKNTSRASHAEPDMKAAGAFWAARAYKKLGNTHNRHLWLQRAAAFPHTFYGLLGTGILQRTSLTEERGDTDHPAESGHIAGFAPMEAANTGAVSNPVLTEIDIEAVGATDAGRRVFALLQVGENAQAENVIRRVWPDLHDVTLARAFQLVANSAGLHDLSNEMAEALRAGDTHTRTADDAPLPPFHPRHGFTMDPALVYALARVESNFDPRAVSGAGAQGLMQIRPTTADFVTSSSPSSNTHYYERTSSALHDPGINLEIGQRYVHYLAQLTHQTSHTDAEGGDMIRLLASYNVGPAALAHWENTGAAPADPLLYIELLPNVETRDYVHRTLTYLWRYASKMKLPAPSLTALSKGDWPSFAQERALAHTVH